jgi:hypothetical protein
MESLKLKTVYFAHPVWTYGTAWEASVLRDLDLDLDSKIRDALDGEYKVLNPNDPAIEAEYKAKGWKYFEDLASGCDALVYAEGDIPLGAWGTPAGIWKEAHSALIAGKPVWLYDDGDLYRMDQKDPETRVPFFHSTAPMSVNDTRAMRDLVRALQESEALLDNARANMALQGIMGGEASDRIDRALSWLDKIDFPRLKK